MITLIYKVKNNKMKTKHITASLALLAILAMPAVSSANTYQYIDSGGRLQSTQASDPNEALATAYNIGLHSGVLLVSTDGIGGSYESPTINTSGSFYQYIDIYGNVQSMNAINSSVALSTAHNIDPHSGVILVTNNTTVN